MLVKSILASFDIRNVASIKNYDSEKVKVITVDDYATSKVN